MMPGTISISRNTASAMFEIKKLLKIPSLPTISIKGFSRKSHFKPFYN